MKMKCIISGFLAMALGSGCATMNGADGPRGPRIVASGRSTQNEQYAEVGVEFSSVGDFTALFSPSRWRSPLATGGSLSWVNPVAWSEDAGRTGRILLGEAVIVGGAAVAVSSSGGSGSSGSDTGSTTTPAPTTSTPSGPSGGYGTPGG